MTALACLRILVDADRSNGEGETLPALVSRVGAAFLESRWVWPRRFGEIAPGAFLLADPRSSQLDAAELTDLSDELHLKLFGASGRGEVTLALMEGDKEMSTQFAALGVDDLRRLLAGQIAIEGMDGRLSRITPLGVQPVTPRHGAPPLKLILGGAPLIAPQAAGDLEISYRAVWCSLKEAIVGNGLTARRPGTRVQFSIVDGPRDLPGLAATDFDRACLEAAPKALPGTRGIVFLPICFTSTIQRPVRESYVHALEALPNAARARLAAVVYGVPRAPSFAALRQLKAFLSPHFSLIDLQTSDPDFQIDALTMEAVHSVTLALPDTDEGGRLAAATRFMANRDAYQRRRIWPAITNVRTRRELDFCVRMRTPFLSGKAVSEFMTTPGEPVRVTGDRLPLSEASVRAPASVAV